MQRVKIGDALMKVLFAWDFDWTLVNQNSDPWVIKKIGAGHIFRDLMTQEAAIGFTQVMHQSFQRAHQELHYNEADIYEACTTVPAEPALLQVVREMPLQAPHVTSVIISDANSVFIDNILQHHSCQGVFHDVFTNFAEFEASGALKIEPYAKRPHACPLCPSNLCKGEVLDGLKGEYDQVVYLGDGSGDFCPCCRLSSSDLIFARAHYPGKSSTAPLLRHLQDSQRFQFSPNLSAQRSSDGQPHVIPWKDPLDLTALLKHYLASSIE